jgi:hypothetical protein
MKRTIAVFALMSAVLLSAVPAVAAPPAPPGRAVEEKTALYDFAYAYPAQAGAIPALKTRLDADLAKQRAKLAAQAREGQAEAKKGGFPFNPYDWSQTWQVVADLPGWLSLSASYGSYSGGAHGMSWSGAMLWDRKANVPRNPLDLFTSKAALANAIRVPFCAALDKQRAEKRGEPVNRNSGDEFDKCIDPTAETVILGSRGKKAFDRIGILVAPYNAGPYVEGEYEVTVPVTPAVLAVVKPAFKNAFVVLK